MDRAALQRRLQKGRRSGAACGAEQRLSAPDDCNAGSRRHDVKAAKMFLRRLEAKYARHVADRDRLFLESPPVP